MFSLQKKQRGRRQQRQEQLAARRRRTSSSTTIRHHDHHHHHVVVLLLVDLLVVLFSNDLSSSSSSSCYCSAFVTTSNNNNNKNGVLLLGGDDHGHGARERRTTTTTMIPSWWSSSSTTTTTKRTEGTTIQQRWRRTRPSSRASSILLYSSSNNNNNNNDGTTSSSAGRRVPRPPDLPPPIVHKQQQQQRSVLPPRPPERPLDDDDYLRLLQEQRINYFYSYLNDEQEKKKKKEQQTTTTSAVLTGTATTTSTTTPFFAYSPVTTTAAGSSASKNGEVVVSQSTTTTTIAAADFDEDDVSSSSFSWNEFSVEILRDELSSRGLSTEGTKLQLVSRLNGNDAMLYGRRFLRDVQNQLALSSSSSSASAGSGSGWLSAPLVSLDMQPNVTSGSIQGAAITAATLSTLAGADWTISGAVSVGAAYAAISKGLVGDATRTVGDITWNVLDSATSLYKNTKPAIDTAIQTTNTVVDDVKSLNEKFTSTLLRIPGISGTMYTSTPTIPTTASSTTSTTTKEIPPPQSPVEIEKPDDTKITDIMIGEEKMDDVDDDNDDDTVAAAAFAQQKKEAEFELFRRSLLQYRLQLQQKERLLRQIKNSEITSRRLLEMRIAYDFEAMIRKQQQLVQEQNKIAAELAEAEKARIEEEEKEKARVAAEEEAAAEQARLEQEAMMNARIEEEMKLAEEARIAAEEAEAAALAAAEQARLAAEEAEAARLQEEARLAAEEAEAGRLEEEARMAEEARVAAEEAEAARLEEEARLAEELDAVAAGLEDDDDEGVEEDETSTMSQEDWEASIRVAQDSIDGTIVGLDDAILDEDDKAEWDSAQRLAQELGGGQQQQSQQTVYEDEDDEEDDNLDNMEALAQAARDAVAAFEAEQNQFTGVGSDDDDDFVEYTIPESLLGGDGNSDQAMTDADAAAAALTTDDDDVGAVKSTEALAREARNAVREYEALYGSDETEDNGDIMVGATEDVASSSAIPTMEEERSDYLPSGGIENFDKYVAADAGGDISLTVGSDGDATALAQAARDAVLKYKDTFEDNPPPRSFTDMFKTEEASAVTEQDLITDNDVSDLSGVNADESSQIYEDSDRTGGAATNVEDASAGDTVIQTRDVVVDEEDEEDDPIFIDDWSELTIEELREELENRGLPSTGTKAELIEKLEESDFEMFDDEDDELATADSSKSTPSLIATPADDGVVPPVPEEKEKDDDVFVTGDDVLVSTVVAQAEEEQEVPVLEERQEELPKQQPTKQVKWSAYRVPDLREECRSRGLITTGKKSILVARLAEYELNLVPDGGDEDEGKIDDDVAVDDAIFLNDVGLVFADDDEPSDEALLEIENQQQKQQQREQEQQQQLIGGGSGGGDNSNSSGGFDFENMTVNELKDELRRRDLRLSGKKADLIDRLKSSEDVL